MKKRNLAILLVIPFLVALFGIATINTAFSIIDNDVIRINWAYRDSELFEVGKLIKLEAEGVVADKRYPASLGNRLVWTVDNADGAEEEHARTWSDDNDNWYLETQSEGKVVITCTTEKGNVTPVRMNGIIYEGEAFVINPKINGSGQNVDSYIYYGEYDLVDGQRQRASFEYDLTFSSDAIAENLQIDYENTTPNLSVDLNGGKISINGTNTGTDDGISQVVIKNPDLDLSTTYAFKVVANGINVYTYQDLLACTNYSENGEIVVLRKNFESRENAEAYASNNVTVFGASTGAFNFVEEAYSFPTTYNREYIDQWNAFAAKWSDYSPITDTVWAGLHVQKDFYGNGYTVNMHNLCFPTDSKTEQGYDNYKPGANDLFKGPKPFYVLGDPNDLPIVTAYGQDNTGVYIDGDNITVNDVKIKNCEFGLVLNSLDYVGTVVEVNGNGNTVKNSVLSNGKNILRSFSSMNLTVDNCILSTSRNFLLSVGSNEYEKNDPADTTQHTFTNYDGSTYTGTLSGYLSADGDAMLNQFAAGIGSLDDVLGEGSVEYSKADRKKALHSLQAGLSCEDKISATDYRGSTEISDSIFYRSGIASIGIETMFNGPFLYNNSPSLAQTLAGMFVPMLPYNIAGASYPVSVNLSGNTRFFDYKTLQDWDISGLIDQNISTIVNDMVGSNISVTIDDIFPLKQILTSVARQNRLIYSVNDSDYINIPIAFYGGGKNLSTVTTNGLTAGGLTSTYDVDLLDSYLDMQTTIDIEGLLNGGNLNDIVSDPNFMRFMKETLTKTVTTVTGFEAFKFSFGDDPEGVFDVQNGTPLVPNYQDLIKA